MDQVAHESPVENFNMKGMVHKNSVEKLEYLKRQKSLEKQKKYFVRQHSRDENEIKQILQRLQLEQQLHDQEQGDVIPTSDNDDNVRDDEENDDDDDGPVNPYPLIIVPKFGPPTPLKDANLDTKSDQVPTSPRSGRRKSLEYEDIDKDHVDTKSGTSQLRTTVLACSFINKLRAPINARKFANSQDPLMDNNMWVGDPEYISSIRRPRKTVAEQNHYKALRRAKSELWIRTDNLVSKSTPSLRPESPRQRKISADEVTGRANEIRNINAEISGRKSPLLKRKNSREKRLSSTSSHPDESPNVSPRMGRTGSWKVDKRHSERKTGEGKDGGLESDQQSVISVEASQTSKYPNNEEPDKAPKHGKTRQTSLKEKKKNSEDSLKPDVASVPKRKSSLKKKKHNAAENKTNRNETSTTDTTGSENDTDESKRTRKISFADQPGTRHGSLKEKKAARKFGTTTAPGSVENMTMAISTPRKQDGEDEIRKPRSKSMGSSPARSPAGSPLSKDKAFVFK